MNPGPELRDIHLPPAPSWWPPAPGWWLLALIGCAVLAWAVHVSVRRLRERRWRARVCAELERIAAAHAAQPDPVRLTTQVSHLLRRASLLVEPHAAALRDEAWLDFLDRQLPASSETAASFRRGAGRALLDAPFRRANDPGVDVDAPALLALARAWLDATLKKGRRRG
ncbi:MAG: DUF4381 domain-containing protein [Rhodanobacter sp.]|jgi:hypothetical protein|nr:DUF4381 domain-containing protein [Rhodanobacter sp.]